jgi:hypothetical protein
MDMDIKRLYIDILKIDKNKKFEICNCNKCKRGKYLSVKRQNRFLYCLEKKEVK